MKITNKISALFALFVISMPNGTASANPAYFSILAPAATAEQDHHEIVVIGEKRREKRINRFIRSAVNTSKNDQYARFGTPVCPVAMGFSKKYNRVVEERMHAVIKAAKVATAKRDCKPNMVVVAIKKSQDFISKLRKRYPQSFGELSIRARDRLMAGPGPAYVWNIIETRAAGGGAASGSAGLGGSGNALAGFGSNGSAKSFRGSNSRILKATQQDLHMAIVVIEKTSLQDASLRQVADYAVMRLLANTNEPDQKTISERSILSLFSDRAEGYDAPLSVTAWDMALLKSLYKSQNNLDAMRQRANMARIFEKELVKIAETGAEE